MRDLARRFLPYGKKHGRVDLVFEDFDAFDVKTSGGTIHGVRGGAGPPLLLLHGIPETHLMWHQVAPRLAERFTVVATDLRGFGDSGKPPSGQGRSSYNMRELARDQLETMQELGYERFAVVGHDRGARCGYRLALDHPSAVTRLAVLDIIPTGEAFRRADAEFALGFWVWSFLAGPAPVPERLVTGDPEPFVDYMLSTWSENPDVFPAELRDAYVAQFRDPERVHAICEQYRSAASADRKHDDIDRGKRRISCPTLVLWSSSGAVGQWYDPLEVWREWAEQVSGASISAGHFLPEEAPTETTRHLLDFLG